MHEKHTFIHNDLYTLVKMKHAFFRRNMNKHYNIITVSVYCNDHIRAHFYFTFLSFLNNKLVEFMVCAQIGVTC